MVLMYAPVNPHAVLSNAGLTMPSGLGRRWMVSVSTAATGRWVQGWTLCCHLSAPGRSYPDLTAMLSIQVLLGSAPGRNLLMIPTFPASPPFTHRTAVPPQVDWATLKDFSFFDKEWMEGGLRGRSRSRSRSRSPSR